MPTKRRLQAIDKRSPATGFIIAAALHLALAYLAEQWLLDNGTSQPLWPAAGVWVGLALSTDRWTMRVTTLMGALSAQVLFVGLETTSLVGKITNVSAIALEMALGFAGIFTVFTVKSMKRSPGPAKSVVSLLVCIGAAFVGSLLAAAGSDQLIDRAQWSLSHGIGMFACSSALLLGRTGWLSSANPFNQTKELLLSLGGTALLTVIALNTEGALHYVVLGTVLLVTARFGTRIGQPLALILICAAALQTASGMGSFVSGEIIDIRGFQTFAAITVGATAMVGRLTMNLDSALRKEQRTVTRWQKLAATGSDGFVELDADQKVIDISERLAHIIGLDPDEIQGMAFRELFDANSWGKIAHFAKLVLDGRSVRFDRSFETAQGDTLWALSSVEPRLDRHGKFAGCTIHLFDTTDAHQINAERVETHVTVAAAQEVERRRLAQRVHDGALQDFAAANLLVGAASLPTAPAITAGYLGRIENLLCSGMHKLRTDAIGTDDIDLREVVVVDALWQVVKKFSMLNSAHVTIDERELFEAPPRLARIIFQVAQEALVNALVHSEASSIAVSIVGDRKGFSITVIDDGVGFDSTRITEVGHLGLNSMTALAYQAGGWCSLSTQTNDGTRVDAWIPRKRTAGASVLLGAHRTSLLQGPLPPADQMAAEQQDLHALPLPRPRAGSKMRSLSKDHEYELE